MKFRYERCEMKADNVFWAEFLKIYKSLPVLWKVKSENYSNRVVKAAAYDKLVNKLKEIDAEANREKVVKKINSFRTSYRRELKKIKKNGQSGAGAKNFFKSSLWCFELLHFLADQEVHSPAMSTESDDDSVSDRSNEIFEPPVKRKKVKEDKISKMACEKLKENNGATFDLETSLASEPTKIKMNADKVFWTEFLEMYKSLPVLWKEKSENCCNWLEKADACDKLVTKLKEIDPEANREKVVKKLNDFRKSFRREMQKVKEKEDAGFYNAIDLFKPSLWCFDLLQFLDVKETYEMNEDDLLQLAYETLKESNDDTNVLAKSWALQYAELANKQQILTRTIFANVLFHGCMNHLTEKNLEDIHQVLKSSTKISTSTPRSLRSSKPYEKST